jgi:hypothetical protein
MPMALRIVALLTLLLGAVLALQLLGVLRVSGLVNMFHMLLGIATVILALVALAGALRDGAWRGIGAWFPIVPLVMGMLYYSGAVTLPAWIWLHALAGLLAVGFIEMAIARRRRLSRAPSGGL